jgi:hypothetical protein
LDNHAIGVKEVEDEIRLMSFTEYDLEQKSFAAHNKDGAGGRS